MISENLEREAGARRNGNTKTGKKESRRQAASASPGQEEGGERGGSRRKHDQILSSTKIIPATWQESVQMSQIKSQGLLPIHANYMRSKVVRFMDQRSLANISSTLGVFSP